MSLSPLLQGCQRPSHSSHPNILPLLLATCHLFGTICMPGTALQVNSHVPEFTFFLLCPVLLRQGLTVQPKLGWSSLYDPPWLTLNLWLPSFFSLLRTGIRGMCRHAQPGAHILAEKAGGPDEHRNAWRGKHELREEGCAQMACWLVLCHFIQSRVTWRRSLN